MAWWTTNRMRLIQNNLRESDANLDVERSIEELKKLSANVWMINAGGIVAFYPTQLEYHYRAAGQQKDLLAEAVEKAHANGIKLMARFDFSKAHEDVFHRRPEWFYRTREGREVNYHGIVHTCINGAYQREYALHIVDEVISTYEVDGIFFNMFGYQTRDYSGRHYGICFCDSCRVRFREYSGLALPDSESPDDPVYRQYKQFQETTTKEMLDRIHALVKSRRDDIAISTYNENKVDIVRKESNTDIHRPHPVWLYSASENVQSVEDSWDDKCVSNCSINAIDLVHRFTGVSEHEIQIRLKESLASGSGLDFCIIGVFDDYPDRANLPAVADIYRFHRENESWYGRFQSMSGIALIKPGVTQQSAMKEYFGVYKMLKEEHLLFDVIHQHTLAEAGERLSAYKAVLIPGITHFSEKELRVLGQAQHQGACLLGTGGAFTGDEAGRRFLEASFGLTYQSVHDYRQEAVYFHTADKKLFRRFPDRDWIFLDGPYYRAAAGALTVRQLPMVEPATYGPPERAFGHRLSEQAEGAWLQDVGNRKAVYVPWHAGELYYKHGYADHKHVLLDLLEHVAGEPCILKTNAPPQIELFFHRLDDTTLILHLLNLSGFNGVTYGIPIPVYGIEVALKGLGPVREVMELTKQSKVNFCSADGTSTIQVEAVADFAAIVIKL
ncbi:alpha-amylase family protein [Paenibacillus rigui]|uniref:Beta-galactosidase trimerisation domain-containing protein n=1 Tax=Paenibacillus rigui TaxID=554312 RepID=A0A229UJM4_9BACL|nr:alpha-amylase family protein [Paenibacillus rigui]OXM83592.1 hypothetical protein CF651_25145 [Paenibacillus rigui]